MSSSRVVIVLLAGFTLACDNGVRVSYYCPDQRTFLVTTRGDVATVTAGSEQYRLLASATGSGSRYADSVRTLTIDGTDATLTLSDSVAYAGCTSAPHP